ncbi:diaminopimelate epimerase [bacterium]|nr:diaminopimelate epimerase [bacterium]
MIKFTKMSASGNDFVVIDNREKQILDTGSWMLDFVRKVCKRKMGIGADGVLLIESSSKADFKMRVFNPDGGEVEMCGNGARCVALYESKVSLGDLESPRDERQGPPKDKPTGQAKSKVQGRNPKPETRNPKLKIETRAGILEAEVASGDRVKIKMGEPTDTRLNFNLLVDNKEYKVHSINTGVPHVVLFTEDLEKAKVKEIGKKIRYHQKFAPAGTNVNFIKVRDKDSLDIRTYERGVEDETLACGTGACASAIVSHLLGRTKSPTKMYTKSGSILTIYFDSSDAKITNLYLEGDAEIIYQGELV